MHPCDPSKGRWISEFEARLARYFIMLLESLSQITVSFTKAFDLDLILFSLTLMGRAFTLSDFQAKCQFFMC